MRTSTLIAFFLFSFVFVHGQVWIELGGKASYGLTGYYNSNIADDNSQEYQLQGALSYGGVLGLNFGENHGLNVEALLLKNEQTVNFLDILELRQANTLIWETLDFFLLYRFYTERGAYVEVGPKFSMVQTVEQNVAAFGGDKIEDRYNENYYSAALGFGGFIAGSRAFTLKLGIRLEYALTDLVADEGESFNYPAPYTQFENDATTSPYRASVGLELSFGLGGIAKSVCGRRVFMFGTRYR